MSVHILGLDFEPSLKLLPYLVGGAGDREVSSAEIARIDLVDKNVVARVAAAGPGDVVAVDVADVDVNG